MMKYFGIKELVCPHVYELHEESAWQFLDDRMLANLEFIREGIGKPIVVNNWAKGGQYSQRGLRCTRCILVIEKVDLRKVYLSAHIPAVSSAGHFSGDLLFELRSPHHQRYAAPARGNNSAPRTL